MKSDIKVQHQAPSLVLLCVPRMLPCSTWSKMTLDNFQTASRGEKKGESAGWEEHPSLFGPFSHKANILVGTVAGEERFSYNTAWTGVIPDVECIGESFSFQ